MPNIHYTLYSQNQKTLGNLSRNAKKSLCLLRLNRLLKRVQSVLDILNVLSHLMTKPTKWHVRPAKTPPSLIRVCTVHMKAWVLSYPLSAQQDSDLSLCWAHSHFVGFVMTRLIFFPHTVMFTVLHNIILDTLNNKEEAERTPAYLLREKCLEPLHLALESRTKRLTNHAIAGIEVGLWT